MKILLVRNSRLPVQSYDDAERVVWWLAKALLQIGHEVVFLTKKGSECSFAPILFWDEKKSLESQIPADIDLVHFHTEPGEPISKPYLITCHDNYSTPHIFDRNTVFVSYDQAHRHGGHVYVRCGIDFSEYGEPFLDARRNYFHFMGNAAWSGKNVRGAIDLATQSNARLHVIGGNRVNFRKGLRITLNPNVRFHGILNPEGRNALLNGSKGLIFPVIWHEPSGLAVAESLYFGCPVFGTPYGALPESLGKSTRGRPHKAGWNGSIEAYFSEYGVLSVKKSEILEAIRHAEGYNRQHCHEFAQAHFSSVKMAREYMHLYEKVLNGHPIHETNPVLEHPPEDKPLPFGA